MQAHGSVYLSGTADGSGDFWVDDSIDVTVTNTNGTVRRYNNDFSRDCTTFVASAPVNLGWMFAPGANTMRVVFRDWCGEAVGNTAIWLAGSISATPG